MAKDGTNRGGRRVRAGAKPDQLKDKLEAGKPASRLLEPADLDPFGLEGGDVGDSALLEGETMPEPSAYLSATQRDGQPLLAGELYRETWAWLDARGVASFVSPRLIEAYAQAFARYIQCEEAISKFGLLGKHPTTGAAIASQFGKNATDADALTAHNQVLGKEIEAQRSKIQALKAALDNASASFGQSDSRTQNWRIQLNNATATLNDMERKLSENTTKIDQLTTAAGSSEGELKDAASGADKLSREVDELGGELDDTSGKTRIFGDVLKANLAAEAIIGGVKAIGGAIAGIGRGFAQAMKDGVAYNASMEQHTTSFTTMLGDQAKAQKLVNDLKVTAAKTPFGMEDLAKNTQTLMAFGISADEAKLRLGQLGDISQGDAQKLESLTLAFAQVSSAVPASYLARICCR